MASSSTFIFAQAPLSHLSSSDRVLFNKYGWGGSTPIPFSGVLHRAFEYQASLHPNDIAVEDNLSLTNSITYGSLDKKANKLANHLGSLRGQRVCLLVRRSIEMVVSILAILKAGGQYVPLDAGTITDEQLSFVITDSGACMVLSMEDYVHRLDGKGDGNLRVVRLEETIRALEEDGVGDDRKPEDLTTGEDGIYVIYTSGTTGQPKGVNVRHKGATNVVCQSPGNMGMRPGYRVAQILNVAFDMCAWEVLSSLSNGSTLCLRGSTSSSWTALLKTVDVLIATPSILSRHDPADYPRLKEVVVGGEVCPIGLAERWSRYTNFHNCCGPTEISILNTMTPPLNPPSSSPSEFNSCQQRIKSIPIGLPLPNTALYLLDPASSYDLDQIPEAVPIGEPGLMWVGGVGVSAGYLNLEERNKERWREDPFIPGGKMFNTNDLGRWVRTRNGNGNTDENDEAVELELEHLGRADDQVKVKGFRVEPDGVGAAIRASQEPKVTAAVVLLINEELWGFVVLSDEEEEGWEDKLREETGKRQPYWAVPKRWMRIYGGFPTTRNGKVDKRALTALAIAASDSSIAPSTSTATSSSPVAMSVVSVPASHLEATPPTDLSLSLEGADQEQQQEDQEDEQTPTPTTPSVVSYPLTPSSSSPPSDEDACSSRSSSSSPDTPPEDAEFGEEERDGDRNGVFEGLRRALGFGRKGVLCGDGGGEESDREHEPERVGLGIGITL